ncbi:TIGR00180 family glycosyltransferase [Pseudomonas protegens]|uniref:TIGR00180 family glycosyltransferase n=1 Tax=Pseudomonas protegens TaxID=380021 RepID=UPI00287CDECD|nr:TIGR00180 family glycosyltransferase [Pseudomonas protegens]MDS9877152.1 TIGR00180 family glycosyltransferase [Pseudomonas protegens]
MWVQTKANEDAAPMSERFTLVLLTHEAKALVQRALRYYSSFACSILVLDSSEKADESLARQFPKVDYRHVPQFSRQDQQGKLTYGVGLVDTPYLAIASDTDFLIADGISAALAFLDAHPDYAVCHGYGLMYSARVLETSYYLRDRKGPEDFAAANGRERIMSFMGHYLSPFNAVTRTDVLRQWYSQLLPAVSAEWLDIGYAFFLLATAKARILPVPFIVREANRGGLERTARIQALLSSKDAGSLAQHQQFAEFLATLPHNCEGPDAQQMKQLALDSFAALAECLESGRSLKGVMIFRSTWSEVGKDPVRAFGSEQFVEMPFYNQPMFDLLTQIEFLVHAMPAGRLQLNELEGVLLKQEELLRVHSNDTARTLRSRLWEAMALNLFNFTVVKRLAESMRDTDEVEVFRELQEWAARLKALPATDSSALFANTQSGQLFSWLEGRGPKPGQFKSIAHLLGRRAGGPQFQILLLDLDADMIKLQATFDSLMANHCKAFKLVVLTTGDLPAMTTAQDTVHFVKVSQGNYIERLNQLVAQSTAHWVLLMEAGDQLTASGLLRASLELLGAEGIRAVAMDEVQRQADGTLRHVFRPGVNLDLLQSAPNLMARHWLLHREVLVQAGGFNREFARAVELDLVLRLIEDGGLAGLAHLAEPLLICQAAPAGENAEERQVLSRHLANRGYRAQVSSAQPGTYQIDYQHAERPLVSIILPSQDNFAELQRCLVSVLQRTRYQRYEVLIAENHSQNAELDSWLASLERQGERIRVLRSGQRVSTSALHNAACAEAKGEYLLLLSADAEVVNANWIDSLLNQVQRPEIGIVGARLVNERGMTTQAGLILGLNGQMGAAFAGEAKDAPGYMNSLWVEKNYSAVSGVCLMIAKALFEAVGGLDEEHFDQAFADVDLCLKVADAGYLTVLTPQAQVMHPGTLAQDPQALAALKDKWAARFAQDTAYNQNLALTGKGFALGTASRVDWQQLLGN